MEISVTQNVDAFIRTTTTAEAATPTEQAAQRAVEKQASVFDAQPAVQVELSAPARELLATNPLLEGVLRDRFPEMTLTL